MELSIPTYNLKNLRAKVLGTALNAEIIREDLVSELFFLLNPVKTEILKTEVLENMEDTYSLINYKKHQIPDLILPDFSDHKFMQIGVCGYMLDMSLQMEKLIFQYERGISMEMMEEASNMYKNRKGSLNIEQDAELTAAYRLLKSPENNNPELGYQLIMNDELWK